MKRFKEKHDKIIYKNKKAYVKLPRKYKNPKLLIDDLIKDKYVKERVNRIKCLK